MKNLKTLFLSVFIGLLGLLGFCSAQENYFFGFGPVNNSTTLLYGTGWIPIYTFGGGNHTNLSLSVLPRSVSCFTVSEGSATCTFIEDDLLLVVNGLYCYVNYQDSSVSLAYSCNNYTSASRSLLVSSGSFAPVEDYSLKVIDRSSVVPYSFSIPIDRDIYINYYDGVNLVDSGYFSEGELSMYYLDFTGDDKLTSLQCQTEYNLIPINSVDSNYCQNNNLCPTFDCPVNTGDLIWSNVYINNILHIGASNIFLNIPDEFEWNYSYSSGSSMNIDIEGYNVDTDYIEGIIDTQKFTPNNDDFNNIITVLIPKLVPGFIIILVLYFIFRFIKKVF